MTAPDEPENDVTQDWEPEVSDLVPDGTPENPKETTTEELPETQIGTDTDLGTETPEDSSKTEKTVPLKALTDERVKRQALEARLNEMSARFDKVLGSFVPKQEKEETKEELDIPDFTVDPLGHLRAANRLLAKQLSDVTTHLIEGQKKQQDRDASAAIGDRWTKDRLAVEQAKPDFKAAVTFLAQRENAELAALGYNQDQITAIITKRINDFANSSYAEMDKTGETYNPVEKVYDLAVVKGYKKSQTDAAPENSAGKKRDPNEMRGFSGASGKGVLPDRLTSDYIAGLDEDAFEDLVKEVGGWQNLMKRV